MLFRYYLPFEKDTALYLNEFEFPKPKNFVEIVRVVLEKMKMWKGNRHTDGQQAIINNSYELQLRCAKTKFYLSIWKTDFRMSWKCNHEMNLLIIFQHFVSTHSSMIVSKSEIFKYVGIPIISLISCWFFAYVFLQLLIRTAITTLTVLMNLVIVSTTQDGNDRQQNGRFMPNYPELSHFKDRLNVKTSI